LHDSKVHRRPRSSEPRPGRHADVVGLLYKPSSDDDEGGGPSEEEAVAVNLLLAKQRNGPTGDDNLTFLKSYTRFESAAKVSGEDVPN